MIILTITLVFAALAFTRGLLINLIDGENGMALISVVLAAAFFTAAFYSAA